MVRSRLNAILTRCIIFSDIGTQWLPFLRAEINEEKDTVRTTKFLVLQTIATIIKFCL